MRTELWRSTGSGERSRSGRTGAEARAISDRERCAAPRFRRSLYRFVGDLIEEDVFLDLAEFDFDLTAFALMHRRDPSCVEISS